MWIYNTNALICGGAGIAIAFISLRWNESRELVVFAAAISAMLFDAFLRFTNEETENPMINPESGGHIWFAPIWVVGIILLILVGLSHFHII